MDDQLVNIAVSAGDWTLDPASTRIGFSAKLVLGFKVNGTFDRYESSMKVGRSAADSSIAVTVWTDSLHTGIKKRDEHLRGDEVFEVATYPTFDFRSTDIVETPTGLDVTGDLRIRDISRSVTFPAMRSTAGGSVRYTADVVVSPKDFGISRRGTTKPVTVTIDATLTQA